MDIDPGDTFVVELDCDEWPSSYSRVLTWRQLGELLLKFDELAEVAEGAEQQPSHWPAPETAYATAPSIISEIGWTTRHVRDALDSASPSVGRLFWLRKAALLDRIALADERHGVHGDAWEAAIGAAHRLRVFDANGDGSYGGDPYWPEHPKAFMDPRGYVRQEYALWHRDH